MPKLRVLSADDLLIIFTHLGFSVVAQKGSHIKIQRQTSTERQTLTLPNHKELDAGTVKAIYRQSLRYISEEQLRPHFYTE